jgi:D-alanine-D-alanine ligase-like ATP-grasp enzyme
VTASGVTDRAVAGLALAYRLGHAWARRSAGARRVEAQKQAFNQAIWEDAAEVVGAPITHLDRSVLEIVLGDKRLRVTGNTTSLDDPVTLRIAGDKPLVHRLLTAQGIPVPRHVVCDAHDTATAWRFAATLAGTAVVKPARSTGSGNGVSMVSVRRLDLARAMSHAGAFCDQIVVEERVPGDNYRVLYLDGEALDVVLRSAPNVRGDGRSSLKQLIARENETRVRDGVQASHALIRIDQELRSTLRDQGFDLHAVPAAGRSVRLKRIISDNRADENHAGRDLLCTSVVAAGALATRTLGTRLAAVDLITPDGQRPLDEAGGAIIEVNTTPGLYFHYAHASESGPVAAAILQQLMARP